MTRRWAAIAAFAVAACLVVALQAWRGAAQALPEPEITRLDCVSYAHPGDLFEIGARQPIPPAVIERELAALARIAACVRTYSTDDGQDVVVRVAEQLGIKVLLGAWLSRDAAKNRGEVERAIALANAHPDTIRAIILGNEVLLRRELSAGALASFIAEAKSRTTVPVTTAEIWSFWLRHPDLAKAVDILTVHVLPYWDGEHAASIEDAVAFSVEAIGKVAAAFPDKPILIGEIGWPSVGRARGAVAPGIVNQARFARGVADLAARRGWAYNLIEGYDQPWKRRGEGTVGGAWGLLHADGTPKAPLAGPISPLPEWWLQALIAVLLGGVAAVVLERTLPSVHARREACATFFAAPLLALALVEQAWFSRHAVAHWHEPPLHLLAWAASAVIAWTALRALATGRRVEVLSTASLFAAGPAGASVLTGVLFAVRFGAACLALGTVLDPRYRDFAWPLLAMTVLVAPVALRRTTPPGAEDRGLGLLLLLCAAGSLLLAGVANLQAVLWSATLGLLALPLVWRR